jgi:hypothetical protein
MVGTATVLNPSRGLLLALGQVPADIPEGFAAVATLRRAEHEAQWRRSACPAAGRALHPRATRPRRATTRDRHVGHTEVLLSGRQCRGLGDRCARTPTAVSRFRNGTVRYARSVPDHLLGRLGDAVNTLGRACPWPSDLAGCRRLVGSGLGDRHRWCISPPWVDIPIHAATPGPARWGLTSCFIQAGSRVAGSLLRRRARPDYLGLAATLAVAVGV